MFRGNRPAQRYAPRSPAAMRPGCMSHNSLIPNSVALGLNIVEFFFLYDFFVSDPRVPSASTVTFARSVVARSEVRFRLAVLVEPLVLR